MTYNEKLSIDATFRLAEITFDKKNGGIQRREVDASSLTIDDKKKTAIIFCGNHTKDLNSGYAYASNFLHWIRDYSDIENVVAYSIFYKRQPLFYNFQPDPSIDYGSLSKAIFEQVLDGKETAEQVAKSLGNITFFGHSAGGLVMDRITKHFNNMMMDRGFSDNDIANIYRSMVFIGYSPFALVEPPIKKVYIAPMYDTIGSAKLVYTDVLKKKEMACSNSKLHIKELYKGKPLSYLTFIERYKKAVGNADATYFADDYHLVATPNLLFDDGVKEDHNFAGVIDYSIPHPRKTRAGNITTQFMKNVLKYSVSTPRENFSTEQLYNEIKSQQIKER